MLRLRRGLESGGGGGGSGGHGGGGGYGGGSDDDIHQFWKINQRGARSNAQAPREQDHDRKRDEGSEGSERGSRVLNGEEERADGEARRRSGGELSFEEAVRSRGAAPSPLTRSTQAIEQSTALESRAANPRRWREP